MEEEDYFVSSDDDIVYCRSYLGLKKREEGVNDEETYRVWCDDAGVWEEDAGEITLIDVNGTPGMAAEVWAETGGRWSNDPTDADEHISVRDSEGALTHWIVSEHVSVTYSSKQVEKEV